MAGLLIKTLAKPLSKRIKHECSRYEITKNMLINIGQTTHVISSRMTIWSAGYKVRSITPLDTEKALASGAEFFGESFIFFVSGVVLVWEYNRSKQSEKAKEEAKQAALKAEQAALRAKLHTLDLRLKAVETVVKQNSQSILGLGGPKYVEPSKDEIVPIDDEEDHHKQQQQQQQQHQQQVEKDVLNQVIGTKADRTTSTSTTGATRSVQATNSFEKESQQQSQNERNTIQSKEHFKATDSPVTNNKPWWKIW